MEEHSRNESLLLSFAIPTYNFGHFIADTVRSIEEGAKLLSAGQFEIVILDGGSQDKTDTVVADLMERYVNIRYVKNPQRGGIDRDMDSVAALARGRYIWLFSADDLLVTGWDRPLLSALKKTPDVLLVPAVLCDLQMQPLRPNPIFRDCSGQEPVNFNLDGSEEARTRYLARIATLEAVFSFMSAIVVDRKVWNGLVSREDYFGSCWAHCARLIPLLSRPSTVTYLNSFLITKRGGNDSFLENGFVARIGIAVEGWGRIIQEFFGDSEQRRYLYDALRRDMPVLLFIYAKISARNAEEIARLRQMAHTLYSVPGLARATRLYYLVFRFTPVSPSINKLIAPMLPSLIWARHKVKALFAK